MRLIIGLLVTAAFVLVFRGLIKKAPIVFYALAIALDVFYWYAVYIGVPAWLWHSVMFLLQKNVLAFSIFAVVMFIGVLSERSKIYRSLMAIRAELSIIACILSIGHIIVFANIYLFQVGVFNGVLSSNYLVATILALLAVLTMIPLLITSFKWIRAKMSKASWKRLQRFSYVFYALVFAHLLLYIGPSSLSGSASAIVTLVVYIALAVLYTGLRIAKALRRGGLKGELYSQVGEEI